VGGGNAIARGIGDVLEPVTLPAAWLVLVHPQAHVRTADVFAARELTRDTASAKIDVFSEGYGRNDLAAVTAAGFATVAQALAALPGARMTGSGSCVFAAFAAEQDARAAQSRIAARWNTRLVRTLAAHPLAGFAR
jgi:4-diphosphocytidyl-2-C-methyl-D-erythritol kinase